MAQKSQWSRMEHTTQDLSPSTSVQPPNNKRQGHPPGDAQGGRPECLTERADHQDPPQRNIGNRQILIQAG
ncbi:hypothetical protein RRG08_006366 [Elysia crispata]|uniref:Uncharacterized protein n=1 Tax=Elysia crispata TaxID=231223 RepID=A0AAE1DCD7_9GAST|nr:hypothetical protein RRG08_006366 [Elysia crispata]